jgi:hypothetical protein
MRRLMSMVQTKSFDPTPLLTHSFKLDPTVKTSAEHRVPDEPTQRGQANK